MNNILNIPYRASIDERETAANSYLMSLVVVFVGLPLPILNLVATIAFALVTRKSTYFVRWHSTQALVSQLFLFFMNTYGFWWTVSIIFTDVVVTSNYIAYLFTIIIVNIIEFFATIYAAVEARKGKQPRLFGFAEFTDLLIPQPQPIIHKEPSNETIC